MIDRRKIVKYKGTQATLYIYILPEDTVRFRKCKVKSICAVKNSISAMGKVTIE